MTAVLEEKDAIRELMARYCFLIDGARYREWTELFTEDGVFEVPHVGTFQGRATLLRFAKSIPLDDEGRPGFKHCVLNSIVEVDGDRAAAQSYILLVRAGRPLAIDVAGRYEDDLVKRDGRWLFAKRLVHFDLHNLPGR